MLLLIYSQFRGLINSKPSTVRAKKMGRIIMKNSEFLKKLEQVSTSIHGTPVTETDVALAWVHYNAATLKVSRVELDLLYAQRALEKADETLTRVTAARDMGVRKATLDAARAVAREKKEAGYW